MTVPLAERVRARAHELGFEDVGFSRAGPAARADAFRSWLDRGYAGAMDYLARDPAGRADVTRRSPWARTVVSAALSYAPPEPAIRRMANGVRGSQTGGGTVLPTSNEARGRQAAGGTHEAPGEGLPDREGPPRESERGIAGLVSCYAAGRDYHGVVKDRLAELASFLRSESGGRAEVRTLVDTSAILERDHAESGGLAWTGKNTMAILKEGGSYVFLGEILTDVEIEPGAPLQERCGGCTRCIDACPTGAIVDSWLLDARRCISYLTIELRGSVPSELRGPIGGHLFGCDICQEVCPWNARPSPARAREPRPDAALEETSLAETVSLDDRGFRARFGASALARAKRSGIVRNALIVAGNRGDGEALAAGRAVLEDPDPVLRETAVWALARGDARHRAAAGRAAEREDDEVARRLMRESLEGL